MEEPCVFITHLNPVALSLLKPIGFFLLGHSRVFTPKMVTQVFKSLVIMFQEDPVNTLQPVKNPLFPPKDITKNIAIPSLQVGGEARHIVNPRGRILPCHLNLILETRVVNPRAKEFEIVPAMTVSLIPLVLKPKSTVIQGWDRKVNDLRRRV